MKKPQQPFTPPDLSGQTKILFCNEGNPTAMLLTNTAGRRKTSIHKFITAEAALAWCRETATMMIYCPANAAGN